MNVTIFKEPLRESASCSNLNVENGVRLFGIGRCKGSQPKCELRIYFESPGLTKTACVSIENFVLFLILCIHDELYAAQ